MSTSYCIASNPVRNIRSFTGNDNDLAPQPWSDADYVSWISHTGKSSVEEKNALEKRQKVLNKLMLRTIRPIYIDPKGYRDPKYIDPHHSLYIPNKKTSRLAIRERLHGAKEVRLPPTFVYGDTVFSSKNVFWFQFDARESDFQKYGLEDPIFSRNSDGAFFANGPVLIGLDAGFQMNGSQDVKNVATLHRGDSIKMVGESVSLYEADLLMAFPVNQSSLVIYRLTNSDARGVSESVMKCFLKHFSALSWSQNSLGVLPSLSSSQAVYQLGLLDKALKLRSLKIEKSIAKLSESQPGRKVRFQK